MNFNLSPAQEAFRTEVISFLANVLTPEFWEYHRANELPDWSPRFSREAARHGLLAPSWPVEFGVRGLGVMEQTVYMDEMAYAGAPQEHHRRAVQQVGPSIMLFGNDDQRQRYLPGIASGEISFAMGLSEPDAGSDLANVQTRALRDGDEFVVNGQKKYTSGAHYSDYLWTVARTDPEAPRHRGISMLVVPLHAPGVEIQPLIDMQGRHHFNKVFFDDVRVPADHLVGEENRGWYINARTMDLERSGGAHIGSLRRTLDQALAVVRTGGTVHRESRMRLAECAVAVNVARLLAYRVAWLREHGESPTHEVSMVKLLATETTQRIAQATVGTVGLDGTLLPRNDWDETVGTAYIDSARATVGQGTSEIQRNVIATRGLGLPR
ncbi:MAG: acyl-CoA dehydrogenase family protein [Dehalococcoidia bacterium]|nr:acyl-CoA dehydrogenase family protein [Dehalococcoidia bacterium]